MKIDSKHKLIGQLFLYTLLVSIFLGCNKVESLYIPYYINIMSLKLAENSSLSSMIVGLCDTKISRFSLILTNNTHREIKKKFVKKSADFCVQETSADFCWSVISHLVGHML